ncbi:MAG TPA: type III pantothenate kinase [Rhodospirillales bacterium]|jgi:type III pantothenate kinase|nr:type III pantothenate kinase [Rhodospirillales bacterium]
MLLAIDSGNTNVVFAVFDDTGEIRGEWRSATDTGRTADEYGVWLGQLMELGGIQHAEVTSAIIATVVPDTLFNLKTLCRKYMGCDPLIVGDPGVELGLGVLVGRPDEVGADRLVTAVAAHERFGGPLIVIDFGTATTFDVIDGDGNYTGGVIAPGINLSLEALHMAAAKLPRVAIESPPRVIGRGTVEAMQSGIFWGYVSMIEGMVRRIQDETESKMQVIATGGLAPLFSEATDSIERADTNLTLYGLLSVHRRNRAQ